MRVTITHPRSSERYDAEVAPACPAGVVLEGLQSDNASQQGPFLAPAIPGRPYALVLARTERVLTADTTMADAGVVDGDVLAVELLSQGA